MTILDNRALNRATLERQLLLQRADRTAIDAVNHLVGMQAQEPLEPYAGLHSRLTHFRPQELVDLLESRRAVRTLLMRRTIHLVSAEDCLLLRPLHQAMIVSRMWNVLKRPLDGVDLEELAAAGLPIFEREPTTLPEAGRAVAERFPGKAPRDLGDALSSVLPLLQVPPRGLWGRKGPAKNTTIQRWLGRQVVAQENAADELILRYLRAYGPAAGADIRAWSGLTGLPEVIKRVRPMLRTFRDERGRELLDVADGALPDPETPAPPRFLPAFDNAVLGFDDRARIIDRQFRGLSVAGARFLLVDGRVAGTWTVDATGESTTLRIAYLVKVVGESADAVVAEGERLLELYEGDAARRRVVADGP
ncbi:MAG: winged helix DNA-binding domain-containing protein [Hamadaea sp.]|nr:winged helix DNA-binding domain-containing protein [Hamadaea sp.]